MALPFLFRRHTTVQVPSSSATSGFSLSLSATGAKNVSTVPSTKVIELEGEDYNKISASDKKEGIMDTYWLFVRLLHVVIGIGMTNYFCAFIVNAGGVCGEARSFGAACRCLDE
jgi:hypothetical protein